MINTEFIFKKNQDYLIKCIGKNMKYKGKYILGFCTCKHSLVCLDNIAKHSKQKDMINNLVYVITHEAIESLLIGLGDIQSCDKMTCRLIGQPVLDIKHNCLYMEKKEAIAI